MASLRRRWVSAGTASLVTPGKAENPMGTTAMQKSTFASLLKLL